MNESRTSKSIKNAQASLIYYFIQLLLGFFQESLFRLFRKRNFRT